MENQKLNFNAFEKIGKEWALVCSGDEKKSNMMTVSWGGIGVLWGKDVVYIFIRDSRYTKEFIDSTDYFSLAFLSDEYKESLVYCGSNSGRGINKWEKANLTPVLKNGVVYPKESSLAFLCKKMAAVPIHKEDMLADTIYTDWYQDDDMHTMYVGEIIETI